MIGIQKSKSLKTHTYRRKTIDEIKQSNNRHPALGDKIEYEEKNETLIDIITMINNEISNSYPLLEIINNINKLKEDTIKRLWVIAISYDVNKSLYDNLKKLSSFITMFDVSTHLNIADSTSHSGGKRHSSHSSHSRHSKHSKHTSALKLNKT